jgi:hypothetical protein
MTQLADEQGDLATAVLEALRVVQNEQLDSGEMPAYLRSGPVLMSYVRIPALSAYVHEALAIFDPSARAFGNSSLELFTPAARARVRKLAAEVRRAIRGFLAWTEGADGGFGQYGRGSAEPSDLDTTACAALALIDRPLSNVQPLLRRAERVLSLARHAPPDALVERANALRCILRLGGDTATLSVPLAAALSRAVMARSAQEPLSHEAFSPRYLLDEVGPYVLGRLKQEHSGMVNLTDGRELLSSLPPPTTALGAALNISAQLDFDGSASEVAPGYALLRKFVSSSVPWPFHEFFAPACGSPALTAAFAASALVRAHGATLQ